MVSYANLGGLGSREGLPVSHVWRPPPPPPPVIVAVARAGGEVLLLPLLLLPLFLCKPNRCTSAWLIWLPVLLTLGAATVFAFVVLGSDRSLLHTLCAFAIGLAATWLLAPYLQSRRRWVVCLKTVPVLAGFSLLAFSPRLLGEREGFFDFTTAFAVALGVASVWVVLALVLGGWVVRRRFGRMRFLFWMTICLCAIWNLIGLPIALTQGHIDWEDYLRGMLMIGGITLGLLLPLLLLSFFQPFYQERLMEFLNASSRNPSPRLEGSAVTRQSEESSFPGN